jgi:hypothetical protein
LVAVVGVVVEQRRERQRELAQRVAVGAALVVPHVQHQRLQRDQLAEVSRLEATRGAR